MFTYILLLAVHRNIFSLPSLLQYLLLAICWLGHWDFMHFTVYFYWILGISSRDSVLLLYRPLHNKFRTVLTLSYLALCKLCVYPSNSKWQLTVYNHFLGFWTMCFTGRSITVLVLTQKQYNLFAIWNVHSFVRVKNTGWVELFTKKCPVVVMQN